MTSTPEIQLLLDCLRHTPVPAAGQSAADYSAADWQQATAIAQRQGVLPLFAARARERFPQAIPAPLAAAWLEASRLAALRSLQQTAEVQAVLGGLVGAGIPVIVLKGVHLRAAVYQDTSSLLRTMSDMDLLVKDRSLEKADQVLYDLGYAKATLPPDEVGVCHHIFLAKNSRHAHRTALENRGRGRRYQVDNAGLWQRAVPAGCTVAVLALAPEDLVLHLGLHRAASTSSACCAARPGGLQRNHRPLREQLNWPQIEATARQWQASRSLYFAITLARH